MLKNKTNLQVSHEYIIIIIICIIAGVRIFIFNAAFPLFNNVDEIAHFDLVYKYSKGQLPRAELENFSRESAELILLYGTPEYHNKRERFTTGIPKPLWTDPNIRKSSEFAEAVAKDQSHKNFEVASFTIY
jgi:hypothetical protein